MKAKIYVFGIRGFPNVQGGAEKHSEHLYSRMVKLGCQVTVFTRKPYMSNFRNMPQWHGVKFIHLSCLRPKALETIVHSLWAAIICIIHRPSIVHIHNIGPAVMTGLLKMTGLKVVVTYHSINYQHQKWGVFARCILKFGEYMCLKFADSIIVVSQTTKSYLEKKYGRMDLNLIPNGVNIPKPEPDGKTLSKYNLKKRNYVFTACRFAPEKGLHDLIAAYLKIPNSGFKLVIAGDTDHVSSYSRRLKKVASDNPDIVLTGYVSGHSLSELFSNASLFVLPSYYEGLPIALLEAISYNLPVLVSDIPQNREFHLPEYRFFPTGNREALARKMVKLFGQKLTERERIEQQALLKDKYDWNKIASQTLNIYKSIIN